MALPKAGAGDRPANARYATAALLVFFASTCGAAQAAAPSVPMFGSYFPSWLLSVGAAALLTVAVRTAFVLTGLEDILRWRSILYFSLVAGFTGLIDMSIF